MSVRDSSTSIVVNYVNVNAFCFYFTLILVEIDVNDIFYVLPCSYSQKSCFFTCQTRPSASIDLEIPVISTVPSPADLLTGVPTGVPTAI